MRAVFALLLVSTLAACGSSTHAVQGTLHTIDGVTPPTLTVTHRASATAPGLIFVAEKGGKNKPSGPVIADNDGRIVWYHEVPRGLEATDFRTQTYKGEPVLTWWQGTISKAGVGRGEYVVDNDEYQELLRVKAGHGLDGDLHEFQLTPRGTAYITAYREVPADLTSVGGPAKGYVYDSVVQEIDLDSDDVVFEWHSLDHVPLTESLQAHHEPALHATKKRPLDYFHVNSIKDAPNGDILVSGRNTSALYLLRRDGSIVWRLGGKRSDFGPPAAVKFRFQHDAELHDDDTVSLFDNGAIPRVEPFTRPLVLHLDQPKKQATLVKTFVHPSKISSPFEGDLQLLADGGALVGWGGVRKVTEFTPDAKVRFELKLPYGDTYRAYRFPWHGRPGGKPAAAVDAGTVYASWNGMAGIATWEVRAGDKVVVRRPWNGLETSIPLGGSAGKVVVRALDANGRTLGVSDAVSA